MAEISDILATLLERTREDKVSWQTTAAESTFLAVLGKASVTIEESSFPEYNVVLRILNHEGRQIESLIIGPTTSPQQDQQLEELYSKARRIALGVDSQLEDLLKELESDS